jgi:hypothetical protein
MKTLLIFAILASTSIYAQTNIIAAKSHASNQVIDPNDADNFGNPMPTRSIERVEYLKDDCIVETYRLHFSEQDTEYDTICQHPFLQTGKIDVERIKAMYPEGTKFSGFEKLNEDQGNTTIKSKKNKRSKKSNALLLALVGGGLFMLYLFIPNKSLHVSQTIKFILFFAFISSGTAFSQTNIIAAKSHSASQAIDKNDRDNFGGPFEIVYFRNLPISVEYIGKECIVEKRSHFPSDSVEQVYEYDTICDHPFLKEGTIDIDRIKGMYTNETEFINFERFNQDEGSVKRKFRNEKKSSKSAAFWLIIVGGGFFLIYLFIPKVSFKTS